MNAKNKVRYNIRSAYYAPITATDPTPTFGKPVALPGAVALSIAQVGELKKFYADGIPFWVGSANSGYEGTFELALIPEQMKQDIWGMKKDSPGNVLVETVNDKQSQFALLFECQGDAHDVRFCFYNCTASRPGLDVKTTEEVIEPQTQKLSFTSAPLADGTVKAATMSDTTEEVFAAWFTEVYKTAAMKAAAAAAAKAAPKQGA